MILGELQSVDGYMNIALEKCEEHVNGVKKRSYGDAFVRGNNGEIIFKLYANLIKSLLTVPYSDVYLSRSVMKWDSLHGIVWHGHGVIRVYPGFDVVTRTADHSPSWKHNERTKYNHGPKNDHGRT